MDSLLAFGVCQCKGVKFKLYSMEILALVLKLSYTMWKTNTMLIAWNIIFNDLCLDPIAAKGSPYLCNILQLYRIFFAV